MSVLRRLWRARLTQDLDWHLAAPEDPTVSVLGRLWRAMWVPDHVKFAERLNELLPSIVLLPGQWPPSITEKRLALRELDVAALKLGKRGGALRNAVAHWAASTGAKDLVAATAGQFADRAVFAYAISETKAIKSRAGARGIELFGAALEEAGLIKPRKETVKPTVPEEPEIDPRTAVPQLVDLLWPPLSWEEGDLRRRIADLAGDVTALRATWELLALREAAFLIAVRVGFGDNEKARKKLETEVNDQVEQRLSGEQYAEDPDAWFLERLTRYNAAIEEANQIEDPLGVEMELAIGRAFASLIGGNEKGLAEIGAEQFSESLSQTLRLCMAVAEK